MVALGIINLVLAGVAFGVGTIGQPPSVPSTESGPVAVVPPTPSENSRPDLDPGTAASPTPERAGSGDIGRRRHPTDGDPACPEPSATPIPESNPVIALGPLADPGQSAGRPSARIDGEPTPARGPTVDRSGTGVDAQADACGDAGRDRRRCRPPAPRRDPGSDARGDPRVDAGRDAVSPTARADAGGDPRTGRQPPPVPRYTPQMT